MSTEATSNPSSVPVRRNWADFPFAPRKLPVFYGWVMLVVTTIGTLASMPGQTVGVGVFTDALIAEMGIDRSRISLAYMVGTIGSALVLPFAGRFLDRVGARVMTVLASLGLGGAMLLLVASPTIARAMPINQTLAATITIAITFFFIRFTGQGCLTLASRVALSKWFERRRGLVIGIMGVFLAFGFNSSPLFLEMLLQNYQWHGAALILALIVGVGMSVLGGLTFRDNPEECGLLPDGAATLQSRKGEAKHVAAPSREFTRGQAISTPAFWAFAAGLGAQAYIFTAFTFHLADLGARHALERSEAFSILLPMGFVSIPLNFISGWASDRYPLKWQLVAMMTAQSIGSMGLLIFGDWPGQLMLIAGYGSSMGIFGSLLATPWPKYYGRTHLGAISGLVTSFIVVSSAVGPPVFAEGQRIFGDYVVAVIVSILPALVVMFMALFANNPQDPHKAEN